MESILDRFIVGTGRCGSTLLSRMLAKCPAVCSLFEFFNGLDAGRRLSPEPISGREFADLISSEQPFVTAVLRRGYRVSEIVYPFEGSAEIPQPRFAREDPLPWILVTMLPRLTADPDALFDEVTAFASDQPARSSIAHARGLFDWLTRKMEREVWIERSGSSIDYLGALDTAFPEARFLHLHRDGREVALSMREHDAYRLPISLIYDVPLDSGQRVSELGPLDLQAAPSPRDAIHQILESRPPPHCFGRYWNNQVLRGFDALPQIDPRRSLDVRFEDLVSKPRVILATIRDFFELPGSSSWIAEAADLVRGVPPTRFDTLSEDEQRELAAACRPGHQLLGRT